MGSIRALATLLPPPCGGNTLRHAGYVLTALRAYARLIGRPMSLGWAPYGL